ncbi:hypothetical protein WOLCODRAFT_139799 [Wolfiporia cocos MD-104 SS10]|uniref:Uncharacterized protein n=1 Tax=Wolfiporia cocos (strain MD-104) TaxID=742152 RepID=A0A2H3IYY0_WOLCO|nr:hypothetical protein WOLCODRAFT_139799 [Wolfiporia cocos MD-104 SS10]
MSYSVATLPPTKRRRTATSVFAGDFDPRPARDALTSLLNGVPAYPKAEALDEELRRDRKRTEREKQKDKERAIEKDKRTKPGPKPKPAPPVASSSTAVAPALAKRPPNVKPAASSFWQARPTIHIATVQRSVSVTPPPMASSPPTTPGPSISSGTSATSSKRPHTPYDDEDLDIRHHSTDSSTPPPAPQRPAKKKRTAVRKGWKGWVEGSPPPSEKLINLDVVTVLQERKTRSGKSFDAIGVGKETWV